MKYYYHKKRVHNGNLTLFEHYIVTTDANKITDLWVNKYGNWEKCPAGHTRVRETCEELTEKEFKKRLFVEVL